MVESDQIPFVSLSHFTRQRSAFTWITSAADTRVGYKFSEGNRIFDNHVPSDAGGMSSDSAFFCVADPEKS
ncbi:MAG: hypothetical protein V2A66_03905 [Pseudomonadota bacterium]